MYQNFKKSLSKKIDFAQPRLVYEKCTFHRQKKEGFKNDYI